ncbi:hypothetical protein Dvina_28175 [Dactylosporangium vinaceum]|uniref:DUF6289 family protein n=1 Tax=Dactylosporangium vinaceum TaxID=53362 RepID=A0ABV5MMR6_9ACTN|nr:DUF6289 family protein [Dactylosporangium vinaceum]UAB92251.1 hypothetical protein Dvina_28175 [Dactylosporangium vinaceum]
MTSRMRRLAVVAVLGIGAALLAPTAPAQAYGACAAGTMCGWLYYSDAARTHQQGGHTTNCQGVVLDWGIKSGYSTFVSQGCGGDGPGPV